MSEFESQNDFILRAESVSKAFGHFQALDSVSIACRAGEIHGLVGENGAGKTTLMKILAGEYQPDTGDIFLRGGKVEFRNPRQSKEKGISLVHQEFPLVPYLNAAENLFLGREPRNRLGFINSAALYQRAREALNQLGIQFDLDTPVVKLTIAQKQLLEIAKALYGDQQILIMDEPTTALQRHEIDILFSLMKRVKHQGKVVIFISHRLEEVFEITDKITVLRNGKMVFSVATSNITKDEIIEHIVGRKLGKIFPQKSKRIGKELLQISDLTRTGKIQNVNLTVREGEILGIAGLEGQGQHSLLRTLFGADFSTGGTGEVRLRGKNINLAHPKYSVRVGFGYVPGNRHIEGLILNLPVKDNISLPGLNKRARFGFIEARIENGIFEKVTKALSIKVPSGTSLIKYLSGGNQQKVVLAKWLGADTDIFILDEPTRGVDVGTRAAIYSILRDLANQKKAIIISSRDLDELIGMSDTIAIIRTGKIIKTLEHGQAAKEELLALITKASQEER